MSEHAIIGVIATIATIAMLSLGFNAFLENAKTGPDNKLLQKYYDELTTNPNSATAYMEIARDNITAYPKPYDLEKALQDINKAIELDPSLAEAYCLRALLYQYRLKKTDLALQDLSKAIELNPKDIDTYKQRASIYYEQEKYDLALRDIDSVLKIDPKDKDAKSMKEDINLFYK